MSVSSTAGLERSYQERRAVNTGLGGLMLATTLCIVISLTSYVSLLNVLVPILCVGIGAWFLVFVPQYYVSFSLWLWFVTPFLRRFLDYQVGYFNEDPIIMIAPYLVSGLAFLSVFRHWRTLRHPVFVPLIAALLATTYGLIITLGLGSPVRAITAYLGWAGPILLAMVVIIHWEKYPQYRSAVGKTMTWGMLALGVYALIQYFIFPPWDAMWMIGADMGSLGFPEPLKVRVWSLLNSPGPFATVVFAALVLQFIQKGLVSRFSSAVGVIGLVLSNVRSAWGGFVVALIFAFFRSDGILKRRLLIILLFSIFVGVPLFMKSPLAAPISERFTDRVDSIDNIENDGSFQARMGLYMNAPRLILSAPLGRGYASTAYDSGWVALFVHLGWFAGFAYAYGMLRFAWLALVAKRSETDHFAMLTMAVGVAYLFLMIAGSQNYGVLGFVMWTMFALTHASAFQARAADARTSVADR